MDGDLPVDNVDDAIGNQNVGNDNLGAVDEDVAVVNRDVDLLAGNGLNLAALEATAVSDGPLDNVVLQDAGQVLGTELSDDRGDGGKGVVVGSKDGDVLKAVEGGAKVRLGHGADKGGEAALDCRLGGALGDLEDGVDDVDHTAFEFDVLQGKRTN